MNHSIRIHYDVVQDVGVSYFKKSDDIHSYSKKKETNAKKQSQSTCYTQQRQTKGMIIKKTAKKRKHEPQHSTIAHSEKPRLADDQVSCDLPNKSRDDDKMANMAYQTKENIHSTIPVIKDTINKKHYHMLITKSPHKQKPNQKFKSKKLFFPK